MACSLTSFSLNRGQYPTDRAVDLSSNTLIPSREIASVLHVLDPHQEGMKWGHAILQS